MERFFRKRDDASRVPQLKESLKLLLDWWINKSLWKSKIANGENDRILRAFLKKQIPFKTFPFSKLHLL
jgi:hypothetical protein